MDTCGQYQSNVLISSLQKYDVVATVINMHSEETKGNKLIITAVYSSHSDVISIAVKSTLLM